MLSHTDLKFLYCFGSHGVYLVEVQRCDLPEDAAPQDVYFWLWLETDSDQVKRLQFESMGEEDGLEIRNFKEGVLSFDNEVAEFLHHDDTGLAMDRIARGSITKAIKARCHTFLQGLLT